MIARAAAMVAALLLAMPAAAQEALDPAVATAALTDCGIAPQRIEASKEHAERRLPLVVNGNGAVDETVLECVARFETMNIDTVFVVFEDRKTASRYSSITAPMTPLTSPRSARAWLAERGLLDRLPLYHPTRDTTASYAERIETLCAITPSGLLIGADGYITFDFERIKTNPPDEEQFSCIVNAVAASNLGQFSIFLGFVEDETNP